MSSPDAGTDRADDGRPSVLLLGWSAAVVRACQHDTSILGVYGEHPEGDEIDDGGTAAMIRVDDHADAGQVLLALGRHGIDETSIAGVYTAEEQAVMAVGVLRSLLDAGRGPRARGTVRMRDKTVQKRIVKEAGLPVAAFRMVRDLSRAGDDTSGLRYPLILKPVASAGTRATLRVDDPGALEDATGRVRARWPGLRTYMLEELVEGNEYQVDGVMQAGRVGFLSIAAYDRPLLETTDGAGRIAVFLDPRAHASLYARARALVEGALAALELRDSVFHVEVFDHPDGRLWFSEAAARVGGTLTHAAVLEMYGTDLHASGVAIELGLPVAGHGGARHAVAYVELPMRPGRLVSMPSTDAIRHHPGVVFAVTRQPGEYSVSHDPLSAKHRSGDVLVVAPDEREVRRRADDLVAWVAGSMVVTS